eukprot:8168422-Lingulodinium_polyedra.AAC.1
MHQSLACVHLCRRSQLQARMTWRRQASIFLEVPSDSANVVEEDEVNFVVRFARLSGLGQSELSQRSGVRV